MHPRSKKTHLYGLFPGVVTTRIRHSADAVYLTFDDGPNAEFTPPLLDLLAAHDAKATFFLVGENVPGNEEIVIRIVEDGHAIGNHSMSHPRFSDIHRDRKESEMTDCDSLLSSFDKRDDRYFRPPYGDMSMATILQVARSGRKIAYWSYDSLDYSLRDAGDLVELARRFPPRGGDIILMHDDASLSREMLEILLPEWKGNGFRMEAMTIPGGAGGWG